MAPAGGMVDLSPFHVGTKQPGIGTGIAQLWRPPGCTTPHRGLHGMAIWVREREEDVLFDALATLIDDPLAILLGEGPLLRGRQDIQHHF